MSRVDVGADDAQRLLVEVLEVHLRDICGDGSPLALRLVHELRHLLVRELIRPLGDRPEAVRILGSRRQGQALQQEPAVELQQRDLLLRINYDRIGIF